MIMRNDIAKRILRLRLRAIQFSLEGEDRAAASAALNDQDIFEVAFETAMYDFDPIDITEDGDLIFGDQDSMWDTVREFHGWVVTNQKVILAYIKATVSLFAQKEK